MLSKDFWRKYFEVYDVLNELIPYQELSVEIISQLDVNNGDKILDLGSGTGNIAIQVKKKGAKVTSIDFSPAGVERHKQKDPAARALVGDITEKFPFEDAYFDKVFSNNVIYAIPEEKREEVFAELYRVMKPGGTIVVSNIKKGFKPVLIYLDHIKKQTKQNGVFAMVNKVIAYTVPTVKMFYYNARVRRENELGSYNFMNKDDQVAYLKRAGFKDISENISVYSGQAILNKARK